MVPVRGLSLVGPTVVTRRLVKGDVTGRITTWVARLGRAGYTAVFKRRDVRVVEGARLEIALTVCDGVLWISITVAKPTT